MKRFLLLILAVAGLFCLVPSKADAGVTVAVGPGYGAYYGPAYYGGSGWRRPGTGVIGVAAMVGAAGVVVGVGAVAWRTAAGGGWRRRWLAWWLARRLARRRLAPVIFVLSV